LDCNVRMIRSEPPRPILLGVLDIANFWLDGKGRVYPFDPAAHDGSRRLIGASGSTAQDNQAPTGEWMDRARKPSVMRQDGKSHEVPCTVVSGWEIGQHVVPIPTNETGI